MSEDNKRRHGQEDKRDGNDGPPEWDSRAQAFVETIKGAFSGYKKKKRTKKKDNERPQPHEGSWYINNIKNTKNFNELFTFLRIERKLEDPGFGSHNSDMLINLINQVRQGSVHISFIPFSYGLREKVQALIYEEKISSVTTIDGLKHELYFIGDITVSEKTYTYQYLCDLIDEARLNPGKIAKITSAYGIKKKVIELYKISERKESKNDEIPFKSEIKRKISRAPSMISFYNTLSEIGEFTYGEETRNAKQLINHIYSIQAGELSIDSLPDDDYGIKEKAIELMEADTEYKRKAEIIKNVDSFNGLLLVINSNDFGVIRGLSGRIYVLTDFRNFFKDLCISKNASPDKLPRTYGLRRKINEIIQEKRDLELKISEAKSIPELKTILSQNRILSGNDLEDYDLQRYPISHLFRLIDQAELDPSKVEDLPKIFGLRKKVDELVKAGRNEYETHHEHRIKTEMVRRTKSFTELLSILPNLGTVRVNAVESYSPDDLRVFILKIMHEDAYPNLIPVTYGLREKVKLLLQIRKARQNKRSQEKHKNMTSNAAAAEMRQKDKIETEVGDKVFAEINQLQREGKTPRQIVVIFTREHHASLHSNKSPEEKMRHEVILRIVTSWKNDIDKEK